MAPVRHGKVQRSAPRVMWAMDVGRVTTLVLQATQTEFRMSQPARLLTPMRPAAMRVRGVETLAHLMAARHRRGSGCAYCVKGRIGGW